MEGNIRIATKISSRANNRLKLPPAKSKGTLHRRDFRVVFENGIQYEIRKCRGADHARLIARIAETQKGQRNGAIVRVDALHQLAKGVTAGGAR